MHPLGIGIRRNQLGILLLQLPQFPGQRIEGIVLNFRCVLVIIPVAMIVDLLPQRQHAGGSFFQIHSDPPILGQSTCP